MTDVKSDPQEPSATPSTLADLEKLWRWRGVDWPSPDSVKCADELAAALRPSEGPPKTSTQLAVLAFCGSVETLSAVNGAGIPIEISRSVGTTAVVSGPPPSEGPETGRPPADEPPSQIFAAAKMERRVEEAIGDVLSRYSCAEIRDDVTAAVLAALPAGPETGIEYGPVVTVPSRPVCLADFCSAAAFAAGIVEKQHPTITKRLMDGVRAAIDAVVWPETGDRPMKVGTWPERCEQRAFVEGAQWYCFTTTNATMWPSERNTAETEAVTRYGEPLETGDRERLRELATEGARSRHLHYFGVGMEGIFRTVELRDGHDTLDFDTCSHPNCVLVRQAAPAASEGQK